MTERKNDNKSTLKAAIKNAEFMTVGQAYRAIF